MEFLEGSYPAHITALVRKDFERLATEAGFARPTFLYTNDGGVPRFPTMKWQKVSFGLLRGRHSPPARVDGLAPARWDEPGGKVRQRREHEEPLPSISMRHFQPTSGLIWVAPGIVGACLGRPLDGDRLLITFAVPPDSIPGFATCEIGGIGNATATGNSIAGTIALTFRSCAGTGLEPPGSNELRLTK